MRRMSSIYKALLLISISASIAEYLHVLCVDLKLYSTYLVLYSLKHNLKSEWHLDPCQKKNLFFFKQGHCVLRSILGQDGWVRAKN